MPMNGDSFSIFTTNTYICVHMWQNYHLKILHLYRGHIAQDTDVSINTDNCAINTDSVESII